MRPLILITARGGSKRLPGKNTKSLGGVSLIGWTARCARAALPQYQAVLSTDATDIAEEGRAEGLEVPFVRPEALSKDDTPSIDVVRHALEWYRREHNISFYGVVLLQPTSPFRPPDLIRKCVHYLHVGANVISVKRLHVSLAHVYRDEGGILGVPTGEAKEQALVPSGAVYAITTESLNSHQSLLPPNSRYVEHGGASALDIDTPDDWALAEAMVSAGLATPALLTD